MDKWFNNNTIAKIIALCVSVLLWAMVHLDSNTPGNTAASLIDVKTINDIKVEVVGFDDKSYVLRDMDPKVVSLEVKGKRSNITTVFTDYRVKLNLENVGPGTTMVPLTAELPYGVELVSQTPSSVKVTIEAKRTKTYSASVVLKGVPDGGLQLGTPILENDGKVSVTLPESELKRVHKVEGIVDVSEAQEPLEGKSVKLKAYDKNGRVIPDAEISPSSIQVDVPMNKLYKTVPIEIKQTGRLPQGYALSEIQADVEGVAIYGTKDVLEGIDSYTLSVDLSKFRGPTTTEYSLDLTPPNGSEKIEPSSVKVVVKTAPLGEKTVNDIPVTIKNQSEKTTVKVLSPANTKLSLTVQGSDEVLKSIQAGDFAISVDVSGLGQGIHKVTPTIKLPKFVSLTGGADVKVEVEVKDRAKPVTSTPSDTDTDRSSGQGVNSEPDQGTESNDAARDSGSNPDQTVKEP
ncbi:CdaR family protein [Paenibacillus sp. YPG26]|uniref:CdaR family protein n=1 Tax=Paenibacillus sp. YPG26 TaxID=2878915 RepID=UPI00203A3C1F|nr:CdaR family protein [Paenibacillus sp. YPG26]USB32709.1 hypothetical protein LDO05_15780 [Paenibacillus sp. YPG26]